MKSRFEAGDVGVRKTSEDGQVRPCENLGGAIVSHDETVQNEVKPSGTNVLESFMVGF